MKRAPREESNDGAGYDSFLDIVANLVGILIILVVVVGAQVSSHWSRASSAEEVEIQEKIESLQATLDAENRRSHQMELDNAQLGDRARQEEAMTRLAEAERDRLQQLVVAAEAKLQELMSKLDSNRQSQVEQTAQLASYQREIKSLQSELSVLKNQEEEPNVLQHHATPLAQTVFNDEIHFRLKGGRLAFVPMDELVREMSSQLQFHAEKLRASTETIETVGPIDQFRMQYALRLKEQLIQTEVGVIRREVPQFVGFIILPAREIMGDPVAQAIADASSDLRRRLSQFDPAKTTVTIWVYPDSYDEYLELETWLHEEQYLVASWPLPEGQPIAGGPNGYRSVAQ